MRRLIISMITALMLMTSLTVGANANDLVLNKQSLFNVSESVTDYFGACTRTTCRANRNGIHTDNAQRSVSSLASFARIGDYGLYKGKIGYVTSISTTTSILSVHNTCSNYLSCCDISRQVYDIDGRVTGSKTHARSVTHTQLTNTGLHYDTVTLKNCNVTSFTLRTITPTVINGGSYIGSPALDDVNITVNKGIITDYNNTFSNFTLGDESEQTIVTDGTTRITTIKLSNPPVIIDVNNNLTKIERRMTMIKLMIILVLMLAVKHIVTIVIESILAHSAWLQFVETIRTTTEEIKVTRRCYCRPKTAVCNSTFSEIKIIYYSNESVSSGGRGPPNWSS